MSTGDPATSSAQGAEAGPASAPPDHPLGVLVVDDQPIIGEAVRRMLVEEPGLRYRFVSDPRTAVDVAKKFHPTVILSDLVMPQMDGLELVRRFRAEPATARIPLLVLSSKEEAATKAEAFALGANDYLVKLPDRLELIARVRYHSQAYVSRLERDEAFAALEQSRKILADDIDTAAKYVRTLLPAPFEGRVRARSSFIPSASLGGDAFGYEWLDDDHFAMYLLDVSGHGVSAALLGVSVLNLLRSRALRGVDFADPGQVLGALGDAFKFSDQGGKYFTIWYGAYEASTRTLRYAGGAHPPALLLPGGTGEPRWLESTGPMPGFVPDLPFETSTAAVPVGSKLLVYCDGVYELRQNEDEVLGLPEFQEEARTHGGVEPIEWALARAHRLKPGASFDDDVTLFQVDFP